MSAPLSDRSSVEAAVLSLQERLAEGDASDGELRRLCESEIEALRCAFRANPAAFSKECVEALRELADLLRQGAD
ncbi:MAG: hypothetical protein PHF00_04305 [Elusimicrobia bacterium]|nr:hypothetical protein [Elusimicrobiota bacterium]